MQASGKIRESFGERGTPARLHQLGVAQLLLHDYDAAALSLGSAAREQPDNARYLSDLSVVQLERARLGRRPDDLPRALDNADRARRLNPTLREAWFNRALALTSLSLRDDARRAWADYLRVDGASAWADEARHQMAELSAPTIADQWADIERRLSQGVDASLADEAVRAQATEARKYFEHTLLRTWADAVLAGGTGAAERERLRIMGDALARGTGDQLYVDTVSAIDRIESRGADALGALATAHKQFADASDLFERDRYTPALEGFTAAERSLNNVGTPFAIRATTEIGGIAYVARRYDDALRSLAQVVAAARPAKYRFVAGRALWFEGLANFDQGRLASAQTFYEDTLATFEGMGDLEQAAGAHGLLTGLFFQLGDEVAEWRHALAALQGLSISRNLRFRHLTLMVTAGLLGSTQPESALTVQDAALANALAWRSLPAKVEVLRQRAATLAVLGQDTEAQSSLEASRNALAAIPDAAIRARVETSLLSVESVVYRRSDPARAAAAASRAIATMAGGGDTLRLAEIYLRLAQANIVWGREPEAKIALAEGIQAFEEGRRRAGAEQTISARDNSWELFNAAAQLAIRSHDLDNAFAWSEAARSRSLAEARKFLVRPLKAVQGQLGARQAILAVNQFADELAVWVIRRSSVDVTRRPLGAAESRRLVARQRDEIRIGATRPEASDALFRELVRPIREQLADIDQLIVVPDGPLQDAAFAGLWDAAGNRFLVEDFALTLATRAAAVGTSDPAMVTTTPVAPLVLSPNDADARALAGIYSQADVVVGADATASRLLNDAPARAVVHVAADMRENEAYPLLSRLVLADDGGRRHSGAVLGADIASRDFARTNLVVLAPPARDDREESASADGLARAFLAAGVSSVVGVLPGTTETQAQDLLLGFHRRLAAGASPEQALTSYQRNALQLSGHRLGAWSALVMYGSGR